MMTTGCVYVYRSSCFLLSSAYALFFMHRLYLSSRPSPSLIFSCARRLISSLHTLEVITQAFTHPPASTLDALCAPLPADAPKSLSTRLWQEKQCSRYVTAAVESRRRQTEASSAGNFDVAMSANKDLRSRADTGQYFPSLHIAT